MTHLTTPDIRRGGHSVRHGSEGFFGAADRRLKAMAFGDNRKGRKALIAGRVEGLMHWRAVWNWRWFAMLCGAS